MKTQVYRIDGMHCMGCAQTIESLLGREPGVKRAAVSFDAREARVMFDPNAATDTSIVAAIERAGFKAEAVAQ